MRMVFLVLAMGMTSISFPSQLWADSVPPSETGSQWDLYRAINEGSAEKLVAALEAGANPNDYPTRDGYPKLDNTPLTHACKAHHPELVGILLKWKADPNFSHPGVRGHGKPLLVCANHTREPSALQELIAAGADINYVNKSDGVSVLHLTRSPENVRFLIDAGASLNIRNKDGETPLLQALKPWRSFDEYTPNQLAIARLLLDARADVNLADADGHPPLSIAAASNTLVNSGIALAILKAGAKELNVPMGNPTKTPAEHAVSFNSAELLDELLTQGAELNQQNRYVQYALQDVYIEDSGKRHKLEILTRHGLISPNQELTGYDRSWSSKEIRFSLLYWAAASADVNFVRFLVSAGADLSRGELSTKPFFTPLEIATRMLRLPVLKYLLELDPLWRIPQQYERAFLSLFFRYHVDTADIPALRIFLEAGWNPNQDSSQPSGRSSCALTATLLKAEDSDNVGEFERLRILVEAGADPNLSCFSEEKFLTKGTPLNFSIRAGRPYFDFLLKNGADPKFAPLSLITAADTSSYFVRRLLEKGADPNIVERGHWSPLYAAANKGDLESVQLLIAAGAKIDPEDRLQPSAFHIAIKNNNPEIAQLLLNSGAFHNPDPENKLCAFYYALKNKMPTIALDIFRRGVTLRDLSSVPYLALAASMGNIEILQGLLNLGAQVAGSGALHHASYDGQAEAADLLLRAGAPVDEGFDFYNEGGGIGARRPTSLFLAAQQGHVSILEILVRYGANVNPASSTPPLRAATENNRFDAVKFLIGAGADVNDVSRYSNTTALHIAAAKGHAEIARLLIQSGATVDAPDFSHCTPLHWAAAYDQPRVISVLLDTGANKDATCDSKRPGWPISERKNMSALHLASRHEDFAATEILLNAGTNPNVLEEYGYTPLAFFLDVVPRDTPTDEVLRRLDCFLKRGADVNLRGPSAKSLIDIVQEFPFSENQRIIDAIRPGN